MFAYDPVPRLDGACIMDSREFNAFIRERIPVE